MVVLEIGRALRSPVQFRGQEFIRVGSYKKKLKDFPEKERALWRIFDQTSFEDVIAVERVPDDEVLQLLDYPAYFELLDQPLPENRGGILDAFMRDRLIGRDDAGGWNVTNLGLMLFAKALEDFKNLRRKAIRVIQYRGGCSGRCNCTRRPEGSPKADAIHALVDEGVSRDRYLMRCHLVSESGIGTRSEGTYYQ